ncbi:NAD(P)-binding protein [Guyanagaster necrorhizus]|uniref:NAD(P)-binding protein n=1 Tax=Guyanagaster necrorhizus TaxID=856835 RepID=A0A9P7VXF5_9AGAR|nr:NAD(P)-binding protein [Guyanagaster necrorhizus MCA 3950]KAG7448697.1 NAD(P)-binding protein [Guyanagaster necrorhizus MCA 3950]
MPNTSRVWFITGTSSGLGKATVEAILAAGERVVATARKPEVLDYLKDKFPSTQLLVLPLDVTNETQIKLAFETAIKQFGRLDIVVNNAGYAVFGEIEAIPEEDARRQFEVQFWGPVHVIKEASTDLALAVKIFREVNPRGEGGRVFNVSSVGGYMANPTLAYYSSGKFALEAFTESFLKEMDPKWNIKGTIIEPGGFDSEWKGTSAGHIPPHPAYTEDTNPCHMFHKIHESNGPVLGSAARMGQTLYKLADEPTLPLRIQFGSEALFLVKTQAQKTISEAEKWGHVSRSTDKEDMDGEEYVKGLMASGNFNRLKDQ